MCFCDVLRWEHDCKSGGVVLVTAKATGRGASVHVACWLKQRKGAVGGKGKTKCEERRK